MCEARQAFRPRDGAPRLRRDPAAASGQGGWMDESGIQQKPLTWPRELRYATRPGTGKEETMPELPSNIQANLDGWRGHSNSVQQFVTPH
jgi:hypothetical protein